MRTRAGGRVDAESAGMRPRAAATLRAARSKASFMTMTVTVAPVMASTLT